MRTDHRLSEAFRHARIETIDEHAKYILFSDCHRGDGSYADDFFKNQDIFLHALEYYYRNDYTYVEIGDGDELWEDRKFSHIRKAHFDVFGAMKSFFDAGRFILIYGNHNIYMKNPAYVEKNYFTYYNEYQEVSYGLFKGIKPCEALVLKEEKTGKKIFIVHGHQGDFTNDQFWYFNMLALRYFWRYLQAFGIKNPASPARNSRMRAGREKAYHQWIEKHRIMLICGHTHRFRFPRPKEPPYFNTGCCVNPRGITGIEIAREQIQLVRWRVMADEAGTLQIRREILRGPEPLEKFLLK